jgi:hypothetical protein
MDNDSDRGAHSIYRNDRSSTRVNALEIRTSPLMSTATGFREHATITLTVSVWCIVVLMVRSMVTIGSRFIPLLTSLGPNSG